MPFRLSPSGPTRILSPEGNASGDLAGLYPSPRVEALTLPSGRVSMGEVSEGESLIISGGKLISTPVPATSGITFPSGNVELGEVSEGQNLVVRGGVLQGENGAAMFPFGEMDGTTEVALANGIGVRSLAKETCRFSRVGIGFTASSSADVTHKAALYVRIAGTNNFVLRWQGSSTWTPPSGDWSGLQWDVIPGSGNVVQLKQLEEYVMVIFRASTGSTPRWMVRYQSSSACRERYLKTTDMNVPGLITWTATPSSDIGNVTFGTYYSPWFYLLP